MKKTAEKPVTEKRVEKALAKGSKTSEEMRELLPAGTGDEALERHLEKLRKKGKLKLVRGRWSLTTSGVCPTCEGKGWVPDEVRKKPAKRAPKL